MNKSKVCFWLLVTAMTILALAFVWSQVAPTSASPPPHDELLLLYVRGNTHGDMLTVYLEHDNVAVLVDSDGGRYSDYHSLTSGDRESVMLDVCGNWLYLATVAGNVAETYRFRLPGDVTFSCGERPFVVFCPIVGGGE